MKKKNKDNAITEDQIKSNICKKIRSSGIPVPILAKSAGLPSLSIFKVLNANATPSLKMAIKLSKALNMTLDELLSESDQ